MRRSQPAPSRLRSTAITIAYRAENGIRDALAHLAVRRGWTPAVIPFSGYAGADHARVLGRVVLAPASVDPAAHRGIRGWRRLLTLESPGAEVVVELGGVTTTVMSDAAGIVDVRLDFDGSVPGITRASLAVAGRPRVPANVHVISPVAGRGVICDIDDTAWVTGISHPARAAWRTLRGNSSNRQSVPGMARLLRTAVDGQEHPGVVYLSNGPWNLVGPVSRFLEKNDFPAGAVLMTDWGITPDRWFRDGRKHKSSNLTRLIEEFPHLTWVLVGDDGEHDPDLYSAVAREHPERVAAIALRQVRPDEPTETGTINGVPVMRGADGDALLPLLRDALHARPPADA